MITARNYKMQKVCEVFNIPYTECRTFGNDCFIVSITMLIGNKLELVINYKGEVVQSVTKGAIDSSFTINRSAAKGGMPNYTGL